MHKPMNGNKALSLLLALLMALSLAACAAGETPAPSPTPAATPAEEEGAGALFAPGTYTGSAMGMHGLVTVEVTFAEDRIESVAVVEHSETAGISDPAIARIPAEIVEAQGLGLDAVAGATFTSEAILDAVADCAEQAGADVDALKAKGLTEEAAQDETIETEVLVVGSGIAGLSAAIEAADAGAEVLLIEKMGTVGGASITCGGEVIGAGTALQKAQGIEDSEEALIQYWIEKGEGHVNEELLTAYGLQSTETIEWMQEMGVDFLGVTTSSSYYWQDPMRCHKTRDLSGAGLILPMEARARELGVEFMMETAATELLMEDGAVAGVLAENSGRTLTIRAGATILATGGYANNKELMMQYAPQIPIYANAMGAANQGDGLIMARDAGAEIVSGGGAIALALDMGPTRLFEPYGVYLYFDQNGERFMDESVYWFERTRILMENDMTSYYMLIDGKTQNDGLAAAVEQGTAFTADTLEELAEQIGVPAEALVNTVNTYNGYCAAGADEAFGKPAHKEGKMLPRAAGGGGNVGTELEDVAYDLLNPYDTPPYSAIKVTLNSSSGTFGGPRVNVDGQVLRADNSVIAGLYAAGEVANGELFYKEYPCSGSATQLYSTMGRFAGRAAAAEAAAR